MPNSVPFIGEEKLLLSKTYNLLNKSNRPGRRKIDGAEEKQKSSSELRRCRAPLLQERLGMSLHERCCTSWQPSLLYLLRALPAILLRDKPSPYTKLFKQA